MMEMKPVLHDLRPGISLPEDWFDGRIPTNIVVGANCKIDSSLCFRPFKATGDVGMRVGDNVTIWGAVLAAEESGYIEVGNDSCILGAVLACARRIVIGCRVFVAGNVTITDSDFHPISPDMRMRDALAISPLGDLSRRPNFGAAPVDIGDDVWVGCNAVILKGVRIGAGSVVLPGAVVARDVPCGVRVAGNPARIVEEHE